MNICLSVYLVPGIHGRKKDSPRRWKKTRSRKKWLFLFAWFCFLDREVLRPLIFLKPFSARNRNRGFFSDLGGGSWDFQIVMETKTGTGTWQTSFLNWMWKKLTLSSRQEWFFRPDDGDPRMKRRKSRLENRGLSLPLLSVSQIASMVHWTTNGCSMDLERCRTSISKKPGLERDKSYGNLSSLECSVSPSCSESYEINATLMQVLSLVSYWHDLVKLQKSQINILESWKLLFFKNMIIIVFRLIWKWIWSFFVFYIYSTSFIEHFDAEKNARIWVGIQSGFFKFYSNLYVFDDHLSVKITLNWMI